MQFRPGQCNIQKPEGKKGIELETEVYFTQITFFNSCVTCISISSRTNLSLPARCLEKGLRCNSRSMTVNKAHQFDGEYHEMQLS